MRQRNIGLRAGWRSCAVGLLTWSAGLPTSTPAAAAAAWETPERIRAAATEVVVEASGAAHSDVEAVAVDERLRLPACSEALRAEMIRPLQRGQGTVAVRCPGATPWRLFVPVRVVTQVGVLVASRGLTAGQRITAADLATQPHSATALPVDYLTDSAQALGLTLRRSLPAGSLVVAGALELPELVARGAIVTLVSGSGTVLVKSTGVALEPAREHERVRVRSQSGRVVEGVVEASGEVRVGS
jgi:flagellar basal body P-ring formation protein FlgA